MTTALVLDRIDELAVDLLRELTPLAGDPDAVREVLTGWLSRLGGRALGMVCARAVHLTFTECLTPTPLDQAQASRLAALIPPERKPTA